MSVESRQWSTLMKVGEFLKSPTFIQGPEAHHQVCQVVEYFSSDQLYLSPPPSPTIGLGEGKMIIY